MTRIHVVDCCEPDDDILDAAAEILAADGLVAFPTETVYGLGGNALRSQAVGRIFTAKGRPAHNPVIVHVPNIQAARLLAAPWSDMAERLARAFWPGPLTLVVPKGTAIAHEVTAGGATVALRVPRHPVALALLRRCPFPLAAPSANRSQQLSPTCAEHVLADLNGRIEMVLDGGASDAGIESTVIDLSGPPRLLRSGPLGQREIEDVLGQPIDSQPVRDTTSSDCEPLRSPGQMQRHYCPRTPLVCTDQPYAYLQGLTRKDYLVGWLAFANDDSIDDRNVIRIEMPLNATDYARQLYSRLHELDRLGLHRIVVTMPPEGDAWVAVRDRLQRAAEPISVDP